MGKIRVAILFGGQSAEHEISILSARNVYNALNLEKYDPILIGIDPTGKWHYNRNAQNLINSAKLKPLQIGVEDKNVMVQPGHQAASLVVANDGGKMIDVVFPILHGPFGEDGTIQGMLKLLNIPFVGPGVLGSAVSMDKDVMKHLLKGAGILVSKWVTISRGNKFDYATIRKKLGSTLFVKPANMGSSIGVSKVTNKQEFEAAIADAFQYDHKIIVEEQIKGREIECAVLGNENPKASVPGEVIPKDGFYSYENKYVNEDGAKIVIPAKISKQLQKKVQVAAIKAFKALCCEGMARVDFFITKAGKIYVNEANTIPGFTNISMYPKMWEASGVSYADLVDKLIQLAIQRHERDLKLRTRK